MPHLSCLLSAVKYVGNLLKNTVIIKIKDNKTHVFFVFLLNNQDSGNK